MLRVPGDVVIEQHDEDQKELWVISGEPVRREERLTLDLTPPGQSLTVRVVESRPVMVDGSFGIDCGWRSLIKRGTRPGLWSVRMKRRANSLRARWNSLAC